MIFPCSPCPMFPRYPMIIPSIPYVSLLHLHCFPIIIHYKPIFIHINPYLCNFSPYHPIILVGILPWTRRKPLGIAAPICQSHRTSDQMSWSLSRMATAHPQTWRATTATMGYGKKKHHVIPMIYIYMYM